MPGVVRAIIALWAGWLLANGPALAGPCLSESTRQAQLAEQDAAQLQELQARHGPHTPTPRSRAVFERLLQANAAAAGARQDVHWQLDGYGATALNAHAMHNGTVVISQALDAPDLPEPMLAAALAHEVAHVLLRHGLQQACFALQAAQETRSGAMPQVWSSAEGPGQRLRALMHSHELQADARAIEWLQQAGYPAHSLSGLLQFLAARAPKATTTAPRPAQGSHPAQHLRITQALQAEALHMKSVTVPGPSAQVPADAADTEGVERPWQAVTPHSSQTAAEGTSRARSTPR